MIETDVSTFHAFMHWALKYWQFSLLMLGSAAGAFVWWLHTTFATRAHMESCRVGLAETQDKKMDRYHRENKEEHKELRADVKSILSHLLDRD